MRAEPVADGVYRILKGYVNAYLIESDDGLVLVDSGLPKRAAKIAGAIEQMGSSAARIRHILITHHHSDHVGSLAEMARISGADVYVHPADAPVVRGDRPPPGPNQALLTGRTVGRLVEMLPGAHADPAAVDVELIDGKLLDIAGGIRVVHTPGHTPGQTSFLLDRQGGVLFAGDAAGSMRGKVNAPIGALTGMYTEDPQEARRSLRRLAALEFEVALFGHGSPIREEAHLAFREAVERTGR
jgi:glyoxylase-like metal-dependent hydrolase (beta-lactamase superfamily II)